MLELPVAETLQDRLTIKDTDTAANYPVWRFGVSVAILGASADPDKAMAYIADMDDLTKTQAWLKGNIDPKMKRTDIKLYAALVAACQKAKCAKLTTALRQQRGMYMGIGRVAMRTVDEEMQFEVTRLATAASCRINKLTCQSVDKVGDFVVAFK